MQFTAAAPDLSRVAIAALKRIRTHHPDFVVLNGDIVDTGFPADVDLAKTTLEAGGCDLVESGAPAAPRPRTRSRACTCRATTSPTAPTT